MKKRVKIKRASQIEILKSMPSRLAREALLRSGAGAHGIRRKRDRQQDRREETDARLEANPDGL